MGNVPLGYSIVFFNQEPEDPGSGAHELSQLLGKSQGWSMAEAACHRQSKFFFSHTADYTSVCSNFLFIFTFSFFNIFGKFTRKF